MDPDPGGQIITAPAGYGSYLDIFVANGKEHILKDVPVVNQ
jgi:hypothetical protein